MVTLNNRKKSKTSKKPKRSPSPVQHQKPDMGHSVYDYGPWGQGNFKNDKR